MTEAELLNMVKGGESSKVQFKERLPHPDNLAHELIAFSVDPSGGGAWQAIFRRSLF